MKRAVWITLLVALVFGSIGAYVGMARLEPEAPVPDAVRQLMAESIPDPTGTPQALKQWQGKLLVVNFWATWCPPCVHEMPELSALQTELAGKNIQILGIGIDSEKNIAEFSAKHKISYPLFAAGMGGARLTRAFGNQAGGLPFTVLIGPNGQIHKTYLGQLKMDELRRDLTTFSSASAR